MLHLLHSQLSLKQNLKSDEVENRQEEIKHTGNWLNVDIVRKFRKQQGSGGIGKKLNIRRASLTDSPRKRTLEEQCNAEQTGPLKTNTGHWADGDLELQFSQERGQEGRVGRMK